MTVTYKFRADPGNWSVMGYLVLGWRIDDRL